MKTTDFLGKEWEIECFGCSVSTGTMKVPGGFIESTPHFVVHQDPLIPLPGFVVIASVRHFQRLDEMTDTEYRDFASLLRKTHTAIKVVTGIEHLTLIQKESSTHFHLWFFPWTESVIRQHGKPNLSKIREVWAQYRKDQVSEEEWYSLNASIVKLRAMFSEGKDQPARATSLLGTDDNVRS